MKCAIFLAEGFEDCEALITVDMMRRAKVEIDTVSITDRPEVLSSHRVLIRADKVWAEIRPEDYDVLILPGGKLGTQNLEAFEPVKEAFRKHFEAGRLTCAICAAPSILGHMGLLAGRRYTCFPEFADASYQGEYEMEMAVKDGCLITGRGMGATIEFARLILKQLVDAETMAHLEYGMQYEHSYAELCRRHNQEG